MEYFSRDTLRSLWPHCAPAIIDGVIASQERVFQKYGLTSPLVVAHAMAQFSHEFGAGTEMEENLNYRAEALLSQWPKHFTSAQALAMAHHPQAIANQAYNGRMGNRPGSDDGWNFRGRGGSQLTGRENYEKLSHIVGLDLLTHPEYLASPEYFLECSVADFVMCGCLPYAQRDDITMVTQRLNGGQIGASERKAWLAKWKAALAAVHGSEAVTAPAAPRDGSLRYGDHGWEVTGLQTRLAELGYQVGNPDEKFGATTRAAVLAFQADNDLATSGIVDQATKTALAKAMPRPVAEDRAAADANVLRDQGSQTVASADNMVTLAKGAATVGGVVATEKTGAIDAVKDATDQFGVMRSIVDTAQETIQWAEAHLWIAVLVGAAIAWYFGRDIIKNRIASYRAGNNVVTRT